MSEASTPSERACGPLGLYIDLRDSLRAQRRGHGGRDTCELLTMAMDQAVESLVSPCPDAVAVVAIGGYGRGELSLYSDVDLMILHEAGDPTEIASALFRPLWDAKLRVGHAVRTLRDVSGAAKESFDTHTTLLTARLVIGDAALFSKMRDVVAAVTQARPLRRQLVAQERERRTRNPYLMMAADLKNGRGGLRTLQGFEWERRREELIGRFSTDSRPDEAAAGESLLQIRNALHAVTGRSHDVFSPDLREPVGRWLGTDAFHASTTLVEAMETIDRLATQRWPEVAEDRPRKLLSRQRSGVLPVGAKPSLDELVTIIGSGEQGRLVFDRLWREGHLSEVLPEWEVVRSLPQLAPFHEHPVAPHLWRTVAEMLDLIADGGEYEAVAAELESTDVLVLSAFLHDIGKGHGGDHSEVGARITGAFCERMSVPEEETRLLVEGVRHHLLLALTATRRDLDDPAVIAEVADTVQDLPLLQLLYLLTVADSRATGPTMWNDWKATLVRSLFVRCAARFGAAAPLEHGTTREEVFAAAPPGRMVELQAHLEAMPSEYLRSSTVQDILWHLELISEMNGVTNVGTRDGTPVERAVVVGRSMPGFRLRVAEAFAANGIDVLEARLLNRSDGLILDTFRVRDDRTGEGVRPERWSSFRADIEAGVIGELDTLSKVASRAAAYVEIVGAAPSVSASVGAARGDLILTVKCADRIGRLAEILAALGDCGLEIRLAQIDSRQGEVIDTFHVTGDNAHLADVTELERRIVNALSS